MDPHFDVEMLLMDDSFLDYCLHRDSIHSEKWESLIQNNPETRKVIKEAKEWVLLLSPSLPKSEITVEVAKLRKQISSMNSAEANELVETHYPVPRDFPLNKKNRRSLKVIAYSASLVLLGSTIYYVLNSSRKTTAFENGTSYHAGLGERKELQLPDGSTAILNSNATITLDKNYNNSERVINLVGDAFFDVKKDADKPFTVLSPGFSTMALGTSFYVHGHSNKENYSVQLLEGKLRLTSTDHRAETTVLNTGELGQWRSEKSFFEKKRFDTTQLRHWLEGKLSFYKTPAEQVIKQLEKWYAIEIDVQRENWKQDSLTGDYPNVPLENVLKVICFSWSCNYSYDGNKIIIR